LVRQVGGSRALSIVEKEVMAHVPNSKPIKEMILREAQRCTLS
jgi:hypothetical protein